MPIYTEQEKRLSGEVKYFSRFDFEVLIHEKLYPEYLIFMENVFPLTASPLVSGHILRYW